MFTNVDGSRGIIGGPHRIFSEIEKQLKGTHLSLGAYLTDVLSSYQKGYKLSVEVPMLGTKYNDSFVDEVISDNDDSNEKQRFDSGFANRRISLKIEKRFNEIENAGTEIRYRCIKCRDCLDCKKNEKIENISIQEEVELGLIDRSVTVDIYKCQTIAKLQFIKDPRNRLSPNENIAMKIYDGQVKKLANCPENKEVISSEQRLHELGFVEFVEKLTEDQKVKIRNNHVKHFIPWRAVWNVDSISTPCRLVFDASQKTRSGESLNSLLAKGRNNMNKLVEITIRWMIHKYAFHTDIQKMYNTIKLNEEHWCYQLYLWDNELSSVNRPAWKVIKTLIYGVKSSGNQAERGLRQTAEMLKDSYPREHNIINEDIYVDDCLSGEDSWETTDNLILVINRGGFGLKGLTFSGLDPPDNLSTDGVSVNVAGMKWFPKEDKIALNIGELNFGKKIRGKKSHIL